LVVFWRREYNAAVGKRGGKKREGQEEEMRGSELGAGNGPYNTAEMAGEGKVGGGIQGPRQELDGKKTESFEIG
jgi:hypothetical protein